MEILYKSTRNENETVTASQAVLQGLAKDGGLFVPTAIPKLDVSLDKLATMSYQEVAYEVLKLQLLIEGCVTEHMAYNNLTSQTGC